MALIKEWQDNFSKILEIESNEKVRKIAEQLDEEFEKNPTSLKAQRLLSEFNNTVSNEIILLLLLLARKSANLDSKTKAYITRNVFDPSVRLGYDITAKKTNDKLNMLARNIGYNNNIVNARIDEERMRKITDATVGHYITGNDDNALYTIENGYKQMIKTGERNNFYSFSDKLYDRNIFVQAKRIVYGSDPCDYCKSRSNEIFWLTENDDNVKFHDGCQCGIIIVGSE